MEKIVVFNYLREPFRNTVHHYGFMNTKEKSTKAIQFAASSPDLGKLVRKLEKEKKKKFEKENACPFVSHRHITRLEITYPTGEKETFWPLNDLEYQEFLFNTTK